MATTKQTAAKKAAPKKTAAKKAAPRKTVAKKPVAKKAAPKKTAAQRTAAQKASAATKTVVTATDDTIKQYTSVAGDQLVELRKFVRDVVDIYVGIPFVLGTRVADNATTPSLDLDALKALVEDIRARLAEVPSVDFDAVKAFVDEAKTVGHAQVTAFEGQVGSAAGTVSKRFDGATTKLGAQLPTQVVEALETGRARLRSLYAA